MKTFCAECRPQRTNKADKSLSVNLDTGQYYCHYCNRSGSAREFVPRERKVLTPTLPTDKPGSRHLPLGPAFTQWLVDNRGISPEAIKSLGLTSAVEFMSQTQTKEPCICFNYYENGELVNTKYRTLGKHFKMTAGAECIPYNIDSIADTQQCIITEGEIDALSFVTAGFPYVISVPSGANKNLNWMNRFMNTHFDDKKIVYIAVDTDHKGVELRDELVRRLGADRCRIITFANGCKDANEHLIQHGKESLALLIQTAPAPPVEGIFTVADIADDLRVIYENGLGPGADTGWSNFDELCTFETGRLCVVTGIPGCGKSEFVDELVLRLLIRHHWNAAFFSPENMPMSYHARKLIEKLTGSKFEPQSTTEQQYTRVVNFLSEHITSIIPSDNFTLENVLAKARELVSRNGVRVLVLDPYNRFEHQIPQGVSETQHISAQLDIITRFALQHNCLVILVAHPRKMNREPGQQQAFVRDLYDINGSAAFNNKCDFGIVVNRDRSTRITTISALKVKFRHLGQGGDAYFGYNLMNGRLTPCRPENANTGEYDNASWI